MDSATEAAMAVNVQYSQVIDRPITKVFQFIAKEHVKNHPRWDPDIELWLDDDSPIKVGTMIHRRNSRHGAPVEGTMEVVEFVPNQAMATVIHDGTMEIRGRIVFEAVNEKQTRMTTTVEIPGMDESMSDFMISRMERSGQNQKNLLEAEV
jgi:hypothetical protein